ncbi:MAG: hypothetical protein A2033_15480 [Bacteroidetes bacterium GWA2_31_9]|nr:MAG: hypothetical protein A2033_15480 [Bacteroidetes bacterium GWA2_31_9]
MNILFTNAGRRTYLIEFALELKNNGHDIDIFVCDTNEDTAAFYVSNKIKYFITPFVTNNEENYIKALLYKCIENKIDVIIPLMDFELPVLSKNKSVFFEKNIKIWVSDEETINNCLSKKNNYEFCIQNDIAIPTSWWNLVEAKSIKNFPVIKKAILGSGSVGLKIINNSKEIYDVDFTEFFLQEYITGQEIGMDIFNDFEGNFLSSYFRRKILMRAGETDKATTFFDSKYYELSKKISHKFSHVGNMDIDFIVKENNELFFIDFNPRFGGGYPFTHKSGLNYLKAIIDISFNKKPKFIDNPLEITGMKGLNLFFYENK